jgi:hypothetical protein
VIEKDELKRLEKEAAVACEISGLFRFVDEVFTPLRCYAAWIAGSLPTFRDSLSVPSSRVK